MTTTMLERGPELSGKQPERKARRHTAMDTEALLPMSCVLASLGSG